MSKAWPILQKLQMLFGKIVMTCKDHPGVDETIRQQVLAGNLRAEHNLANPDFQLVVKLATTDAKAE